MQKILKEIEKYLIFIVVGIFAIFVLPHFTAAYIVPKEIFGVIGISLIFIVWGIRSIIKGELTLNIGKFDLGVLFVLIASILSGVFATPNKMEAFFSPGAVTFIIIAALLYFLINQFDKKTKGEILIVFLISGVFVSISTMFAHLGIFSKIPQLPSFMKDPLFNSTGGAIPAAIYLFIAAIVGVILIIKDKDIFKRIFLAVSALVIIIGLISLISQMLPGKSQSFAMPGLGVSWSVAIDTLKNNPIWGVGPGNYVSAFSLYRPIGYNSTSLWLVKFASANNFYLTFITETGLVGLFAISVLLIGIYKLAVSEFKKKKFGILPLVLLIIILGVLPASPVVVFIFMVLLAVFSESEEKNIVIANGKVPAIIVFAPIYIGIIILTIFATKAVKAEATYKKALIALSENKAKETYGLMISAVNQNPYVDRYRASLAQVNIALASSMASKKELTDADKSSISQLIQSAIAEGKATVALNTGRSANWEVLAKIYNGIMPFAQGADGFAIETYTQAIALDPINTNLRIELGGIYYALGRYDEAVDAFKLAVLTKADHPNAHYNLAVAYREKKDFDNAIAQINAVLSLVPVDSADYNLAKGILDELQKSKPAAKSTEGTNLTSPQSVEKSNINPPITLPNEATPPATTP